MVNGASLDLTVFPKELGLLMLLVRMDNEKRIPDNYKDLFVGIDWELFLKLARHHRLYPIIYLLLKKLETGCIPEPVIKILHRDYCKNTFQMLYLSQEMERISRLFTENNLRIIILKGPVIAKDLYGDISCRTSVDLDIFVPIKDLEKIDIVLKDAGYMKEEYFSKVLNEWKWRHHHLNFVHSISGVKLEVHWRLCKGPGKEPGFDEMWNRKRISSLTSYPVYYLGKEDLFLYLVTHGSRHGWSKLGWLLDIHKILQQNPELDKMYRLLKKYQRLHIGGQALILCSELFNTSVKEEIQTLKVGKRSVKLARDALFYLRQMVNLHSPSVPENVSKYHKKHLFALMSGKQKFLFIMSFFYPYPIDVELLPLPKFLHFLYFPLRPVFWAWRKTAKRE